MPDPIAQAVELYNQACLLREGGQFAETETLYAQSLSLFEQAEGPQSLNVASLWVALADIHLRCKQYERCAETAKRALEIVDFVGQSLASPDLSLLQIRALSWLGLACCSLARYVEAEAALQAALNVALAEFGLAHSEAEQARNNLAFLPAKAEQI